MGSSRNRILGLTAASLAVGVVACEDVTTDEVTTQPDGAVLQDDVTSASGAALGGDATIEMEFQATWNPELETFEFETLNERLTTPLLEMENGEVLREAEQGLFCEIRVTQGRPNTVGLGTEFIGLDPGSCGFAGFPYDALGTFCADIRVDNFYSVELANTYAEIQSISPDTGHNGYAYPQGTGVNPGTVEVGNNSPSNGLGLWSHGTIAAGTGETERWTFQYTPEPFSFRGRIVAQVAETCDNADNDCDGTIDEGARCYAEGAECTTNEDCATFNCDAGFCGPQLPEDCAAEGDEDGNGLADCLDFTACADQPDPFGGTCPSCGVRINDIGVYTGTNLGQGDNTDVTAGDGEDFAWFFTPSVTGDYDLSTCGSSFDTKLEVFDGGCTTAGTSLAYNDDNSGICGPGFRSALTVTLTAGTEYMIVVDGYNGATGDIELRIAYGGPESDFGAGACIDGQDNNGDGLIDCDDPTCALVDGCPAPYGSCDNPAGIALGNTVTWNASEDDASETAPFQSGGGPGLCPFSQNGRDRAFAWTAPDSGTVTATMLSTGDASLYVRTSCATDVGDTVCADATVSNEEEVITWDAVAGTTYYIIADHFGTGTGYDVELTIVGTETYGAGTCDDGLDGDLDGLIDCDDSDCTQDAACYVSFPYTETFGLDDGRWVPSVIGGDAFFEYDAINGLWTTYPSTIGSGDWVTITSPVIDLTAPGQAPNANVRLDATIRYEFYANEAVGFVTFIVDGTTEYLMLPTGLPYDTITSWNLFQGWGDQSNGDGSAITISEVLGNTSGASTLQVIFHAYGDLDALNDSGMEVLDVSVSPAPPEDCTNGIDDSLDGLIDCEDSQCTASCSAEICDNGIDDETAGGAYLGDGFTDCDDDECVTDPACLITLPYSENFDADDGDYTQQDGFEWGIPAGTTIATDADGAGSAWVTDLDANYVTSRVYAIISQRIDLSANVADQLFLEFDYILQTEDGWDVATVQASIDDGASFQILNSVVSGWDVTGEQDTDVLSWTTARFDMTALAGEPEVRIAFVFESDSSTVGGEGLGIDNVVFDITPVEICDGLGGDEDGDTLVDCLDDDCWAVPGTCPEVCDGANFDEDGGGESKDCDDADCAASLICLVIDTFPYATDFEADNGGWIGTGNWQYGAVAGSVITAAASGSNAWVTNLTGDYTNNAFDTLTSPRIDASALGADPVLLFNGIRELENGWDKVQVQISTDDGTTWAPINTGGGNWHNLVGDGTPTLNDCPSGTAGDTCFSGDQLTWTESFATLAGATGSTETRVRFVFTSDSSGIREGFGFDDLQVIEPIAEAPGVSCQDGLDNDFNGVADCQDAACGTDPGCVEVCDGLGFDEDGDTFADCADSDCTGASLCITEITTFPYTTDFSAGPEGWTVSGGTWEYGTASTSLFGAAMTTPGWVTDLDANYANNLANVTLTSPTFNLTSFVADGGVSLAAFSNMEACCDDVTLQYSLDDGATWAGALDVFNDGASGVMVTLNEAYIIPGSAGQLVKLRLVLDSDSSLTREGFALNSLAISESGAEVAGGASCSDAVDNDFDGLADCGDSDCYDASCAEICDVEGNDEDADGNADCADSDCWVLGGGCAEICTGGDDEDGDGDIDCADADCAFDPACATITIPYTPDFDASAGGWSVISGDWAWGAPAQSAPLDAAPVGSTNVWMTGLSANYANGVNHIVESPVIDASATTNDLIFQFDQAADIEASWDEWGLEYSVDGGTTWLEPGPSGAGTWTTDTGTACASLVNEYCWEDDILSWATYATVLQGTGGAADLRIRVTFQPDSSNNGPGIAFDNVSITEGAAEVCDSGSDDDLDGDTDCADSDCAAFPACQEVCTGGVDEDLDGDIDCNDSDCSADPACSLTVYFEDDFEVFDAAWTATGSWAWGTPANTAPFDAAASGTGAYATNLTGNYSASERVYLTSPSISLAGATAPFVDFNMLYNSEGSWDGMNVQVSTDGGTTWAYLNSFLAGNSYTFASSSRCPSTTTGNTATTACYMGNQSGLGYVLTRLDLTAYAGSSVMVRFAFASDTSGQFAGFIIDDFRVAEF